MYLEHSQRFLLTFPLDVFGFTNLASENASKYLGGIIWAIYAMLSVKTVFWDKVNQIYLYSRFFL